jgi:ubiquinone/menaquinone biosynthesis C-methylase UbiE
MKLFDQAAAFWDQNPERIRLNNDLADKILQYVPVNPEMRSLELGCGTGIMAFMLSGQLGRIDAVDTSVGMIDKLNEKLSSENAPQNIYAHNIELDENSFEAGSFDFIYTILTLHHIEDTSAIICMLAKLLKSGGHIALVDLDVEDGSFHKDSESGVEHLGFDRSYIENILAENGFTNIKNCEAARRKRENEDGSVKEFPLFLVTGEKK